MYTIHKVRSCTGTPLPLLFRKFSTPTSTPPTLPSSTTVTDTPHPQLVAPSGKLASIPKAYNPIEHESKTIEKWKNRQRQRRKEGQAQCFPGHELDTETFRMILPPPNVTGKLHLGHALTVAIQDTILRIKLMKGSKVEWIPGFDHAGIATHSVVTRKIQRTTTKAKNEDEAKPKSDLLEQLKSYADTNRQSIKNQLDILGAQLDWDKEYYTLDDNHSIAVEEAFIKLYEDGIIHRGNGIVNWSCKLQSSVADIEVDNLSFDKRITLKSPGLDKPVEFGILYFVAYQIHDTDAKIVVATSRPETMFGDVAIAVHPDDPKYQEFIGKQVVNPVNGQLIPVISDDAVKMNFGTGAVKITPAHDKMDFLIGSRNNLSPVKIYNPDGTLNSLCGEFEGTHRFKAREEVLAYLKSKGSLLSTTEYGGSVGICSRTRDIIEPWLLPHWFFQTKRLTDIFLAEVQSDNFTIKPDYMRAMLSNQLASPLDWCLSRQIQWGHKIPMYYHKDHPEVWVCSISLEGARIKLEEKLKINIPSTELVKQDPDVLDTWFSSALIPLSISHWPENKNINEISLLETGQDILLFWVWRMVMMSLAITGKFPFKNVLLHGLVTDHYGSKMSKSRGNVVDPLDIVFGKTFEELKADSKAALDSGDLDPSEHDLRIHGLKKDFPNGFKSCGADALRFSLLNQDISDPDVKLDLMHMENCKHFCNKLWQAMRLYYHYADKCQVNIQPNQIEKPDITKITSFPNIWILSSLQMISKIYEDNIRTCKFHLLTEAIRGFFYALYCDVYIELIKNDLKNNTNVEENFLVMRYVMLTALKFAHPFIPFVTEEVWSTMTEDSLGLLIDQKTVGEEELMEFKNHDVHSQMERLLRVAKEIRSLKGRYSQTRKKEDKQPKFYVEVQHEDSDLVELMPYLQIITNHKEIQFEKYGQSSMTDLVSTTIQINGVRNLRVSLPREVLQGPLEAALTEVQLIKLRNRLDELKTRYESPIFQETANPILKNKYKRRIDSVEARIRKIQFPELDPQEPSPTSPTTNTKNVWE